MGLEDLRKQIDEVDDQFIDLFKKRMQIVSEIADVKKSKGMPIIDPSRERAKLMEVSEKAGEGMDSYTRILFSMMFEMSRSYQARMNTPKTKLAESIEEAIASTDKVFPKNLMIACQGVEGAYSQMACDKLFETPNILYCSNFEGVFGAVDKGLCKYGVLPRENSTAGSVNQIYDLMMKYKFNIIRSVRVKIDHNLLVKKGVKIEDVKEVFSHEQAIGQCSEFLRRNPKIKVTICENTAVAAKNVAESDRKDVAAIASYSCAQLYGLHILESYIQDKGNNYTRFICISKNIEIYPGANRTSLMMTLPHKSGSLYKILARLFVLDMNLVKLESRPIPERDFEFMFYFDVETSVYSEEFIQLINELDELSDTFRYLGSYSEIV